MTDATLFAALTDVPTLGLTLWGECRSEPLDGRVAVGYVVWHRVVDPRWPDTVKGVCLQPKQFSCWNVSHDPNSEAVRLMGESLVSGVPPTGLLRECLWVAQGVLDGLALDRFPTANHYLTDQLYRLATPRWATAMPYLGKLGAHVFLKG